MTFAIDLLRHLFAVFVILQHMPSAARYSAQTTHQLFQVIDLVDGAVAGFFLISGFLFKRPASLLAYGRHQAVRLLVPFFLFSLLYAVALWMLGKMKMADGLWQTMVLHGTGMQLYYLPYLVLITLAYAAIERHLHGRRGAQLGLGLLTLLSGALALMLPTPSSTGSDPRLLPYFFAAFLAGAMIRAHWDARHSVAPTAVLAALALAIGWVDARFFDLAAVLGLFCAAQWAAAILPNQRMHGSGGIFLLHTPILNFTISSLLLKIPMTQVANIVASVLVTYSVCLLATRCVIRHSPAQRWLLLE